MTRPPPAPNRDDLPADEIAAYDRTVERISGYSEARKWGAGPGGIQPYYAILLNSPDLADHISGIPAVIRRRAAKAKTGLTDKHLEWADLVAARDMNWNRAFHSHVGEALAAGVRLEAIKALRTGRTDALTPEERNLAEYIGKVQTGAVTDDDYAGIVTLFGLRGAVEFTAFIGFLMLNFRAMQAFGIPDRADSEVDLLLAELAG